MGYTNDTQASARVALKLWSLEGYGLYLLTQENFRFFENDSSSHKFENDSSSHKSQIVRVRRLKCQMIP